MTFFCPVTRDFEISKQSFNLCVGMCHVMGYSRWRTPSISNPFSECSTGSVHARHRTHLPSTRLPTFASPSPSAPFSLQPLAVSPLRLSSLNRLPSRETKPTPCALLAIPSQSRHDCPHCHASTKTKRSTQTYPTRPNSQIQGHIEPQASNL